VPWNKSLSKFFVDTLESLAKHYDFKLTTPFGQLPREIKNVLFYGSGEEEIRFEYHDDRKSEIIEQPFAGIIPSLEEKYHKVDTAWMKEELSRFQSKHNCSMTK